MPPIIGTLNEGSLHAALKAMYARPGDQLEVPLDGFVIDIRQPDRLIEIQTAAFGAMGRKFDRLLDQHRILLVHPIVVAKPKPGSIYALFEELVSIPTLLDHPNLTLDAVLVAVTKGQLRKVHEVRHFDGTADLAALLPADLPREFTTADLARAAGVSRHVAQQMAFCLRALEVITEVGRTKTGIHYRHAKTNAA